MSHSARTLEDYLLVMGVRGITRTPNHATPESRGRLIIRHHRSRAVGGTSRDAAATAVAAAAAASAAAATLRKRIYKVPRTIISMHHIILLTYLEVMGNMSQSIRIVPSEYWLHLKWLYLK